MSDTTKHKPILAFHRIYRTARGKQKHEVTYYHNEGHDLGRTELMVPCIVENAPPNDPHSGDWTNLLAWYLRTKDLPGAREAYDRDDCGTGSGAEKTPQTSEHVAADVVHATESDRLRARISALENAARDLLLVTADGRQTDAMYRVLAEDPR